MGITMNASEIAKERPIIFSAAMVEHILSGTKTMTRRVIRPQRMLFTDYDARHCPYGQPGDRLWVRESCRAEEWSNGLGGVRYLSDNAFRPIEDAERRQGLSRHRGHAVSPIHMPRWASRITLVITNIRVERLQEITSTDIMAEGIGDVYKAPEQLRPMFAGLWDNINAARGYSWASNPWVWVIEFQRIPNPPPVNGLPGGK